MAGRPVTSSRQSVVPELSRPVQPSNGVDPLLRTPVEDTDVEVAVRIVRRQIGMTDFKVNDQLGECKKKV